MNPVSILGILAFIIAVGLLVYATRYSIHQKEKWSDILNIDQLTSDQFRAYFKSLLEAKEYNIKKTEPTEHFGPLLLANVKDEKVIIKNVIAYDKVGIEELEEMPSAKEYFNTDEMLVVTNSYFSRAARNFAQENGITLFNRDEVSLLTSKK